MSDEGTQDADSQGESQNGDWRTALPEDIRDNPGLKDVKDVGGLAQQFLDAQAYIGTSIRIPSEDASDDDRSAFYSKLQEKVPGLARIDPEDGESFKSVMRRFGAPEEADDYELPKFEDLPEGMGPSPLVNVLRKAASESNFTQSQFQEVAKAFTEAEMAKLKESQDRHNEEMGALSKEWGDAFDAKKGRAIRAAELTEAPEAMVQAMKDGKVRAEVYKWMDSVADRLGKNFKAGGDEDVTEIPLTPQQAQDQLDDIRSNKDHPFNAAPKGSPEKLKAMERVLELQRLANPESRRTVFESGRELQR